MFNEEKTLTVADAVRCITLTGAALNKVTDPELQIGLLSPLQALAELLYNLCDEKLEELFDNIPVREDSTTPPLACQVDD